MSPGVKNDNQLGDREERRGEKRNITEKISGPRWGNWSRCRVAVIVKRFLPKSLTTTY